MVHPPKAYPPQPVLQDRSEEQKEEPKPADGEGEGDEEAVRQPFIEPDRHSNWLFRSQIPPPGKGKGKGKGVGFIYKGEEPRSDGTGRVVKGRGMDKFSRDVAPPPPPEPPEGKGGLRRTLWYWGNGGLGSAGSGEDKRCGLFIMPKIRRLMPGLCIKFRVKWGWP